MNEPRLITSRDLIRQLPERWKNQYDGPHGNKYWDTVLQGRKNNLTTAQIYNKLTSLDLKTVSRAEVDEIIGNDSWTLIQCTECLKHVEKVVHFNDPPNSIEGIGADICRDCFNKAVNLWKIS
jgi:hypothetical protein